MIFLSSTKFNFIIIIENLFYDFHFRLENCVAKFSSAPPTLMQILLLLLWLFWTLKAASLFSAVFLLMIKLKENACHKLFVSHGECFSREFSFQGQRWLKLWLQIHKWQILHAFIIFLLLMLSCNSSISVQNILVFW